jgi:acylphosphatase
VKIEKFATSSSEVRSRRQLRGVANFAIGHKTEISLPESGTALRTVRVTIKGTVQGVGFRYWTEAVATELGLTGWVRNRADGSVEAVFSGSPEAVDEMLERCRNGPPSAQVDDVEMREGEPPPSPGFSVLRTA